MKRLLSFTLFSLLTFNLFCQTITGKVVDSSNGSPLEYASIGVVNTPSGTITDKQGNFKVDITGLSPESIVRISMISYKPQQFTIKELVDNKNHIKLIETPMQIAAVVIKPWGKPKKVGTTSFNRWGNWCGWGGSSFGRGHEIGTRIVLGATPVRLNSLHIHVHRQAFDSSLYRLHIRTIIDKLPADELLTSNIILSITEESGWVDIDLKKYNIVLMDDVAVTLEWVNVMGVNKNRAMKINNKQRAEYVLFNSKRKQGTTFTRWGTEAKWVMKNDGSPSIYLTVQP